MNHKGIIKIIGTIRGLANNFIIEALRLAGEEGIVPSHGEILMNLYRKNHLAMKEIASRIGRKKNTVTVLVNKLHALGYLQKIPDPQDKRITIISLTEKGKAFFPTFMSISVEMTDKIYRGFSDEDKKQLMEYLQKIITNMSE